MTDNELIANNSIIDGFMGYKYYVGYGYNGDLYYDEAVIDPDESDFVQAPPLIGMKAGIGSCLWWRRFKIST